MKVTINSSGERFSTEVSSDGVKLSYKDGGYVGLSIDEFDAIAGAVAAYRRATGERQMGLPTNPYQGMILPSSFAE